MPTRKMISLIAIICSEVGITAWRQSHHNILKIKRLLRSVQKLRHSTSKDEAKRQKRDKFIIAKHKMTSTSVGVCNTDQGDDLYPARTWDFVDEPGIKVDQY